MVSFCHLPPLATIGLPQGFSRAWVCRQRLVSTCAALRREVSATGTSELLIKAEEVFRALSSSNKRTVSREWQSYLSEAASNGVLPKLDMPDWAKVSSSYLRIYYTGYALLQILRVSAMTAGSANMGRLFERHFVPLVVNANRRIRPEQALAFTEALSKICRANTRQLEAFCRKICADLLSAGAFDAMSKDEMISLLIAFGRSQYRPEAMVVMSIGASLRRNMKGLNFAECAEIFKFYSRCNHDDNILFEMLQAHMNSIYFHVDHTVAISLLSSLAQLKLLVDTSMVATTIVPQLIGSGKVSPEACVQVIVALTKLDVVRALRVGDRISLLSLARESVRVCPTRSVSALCYNLSLPSWGDESLPVVCLGLNRLYQNIDQIKEETAARQAGIAVQALNGHCMDAETLDRVLKLWVSSEAVLTGLPRVSEPRVSGIHGEVRAALKSLKVSQDLEVRIDAFWGCDMFVKLVSDVSYSLRFVLICSNIGNFG